MANGNGNAGGKKGPWDVVMYLVQKSPLFALVVLLFGAGVQLYALSELQVLNCDDAEEVAQARKRVLTIAMCMPMCGR